MVYESDISMKYNKKKLWLNTHKILKNPENMRMNWSLSVRTTAENPPENVYASDNVTPRQRAVNLGISHTWLKRSARIFR